MRARQHAKRHLLNAVPADDTRYASFTLRPVNQLAAFHPEACDQQVRSIEIAQLASYPLLLLEPGANMIGDVFKLSAIDSARHSRREKQRSKQKQ